MSVYEPLSSPTLTLSEHQHYERYWHVSAPNALISVFNETNILILAKWSPFVPWFLNNSLVSVCRDLRKISFSIFTYLFYYIYIHIQRKGWSRRTKCLNTLFVTSVYRTEHTISWWENGARTFIFIASISMRILNKDRKDAFPWYSQRVRGRMDGKERNKSKRQRLMVRPSV
jgi:hypothetical protein